MAYSVAYFGALTPDRVIKHNLIHYLLRGPFVGAVVIFAMLAVPRVQKIMGLPRATVLIFTVVGVIVLLQLIINRAKRSPGYRPSTAGCSQPLTCEPSWKVHWPRCAIYSRCGLDLSRFWLADNTARRLIVVTWTRSRHF
jgi:hypothetical protein